MIKIGKTYKVKKSNIHCFEEGVEVTVIGEHGRKVLASFGRAVDFQYSNGGGFICLHEPSGVVQILIEEELDEIATNTGFK
jgi:hypothetical protein